MQHNCLHVCICTVIASVQEIKAAVADGSRPRPGPFSNTPH